MTTCRLWWSNNTAGPAHQCQSGRGEISGVTLVSQHDCMASEIQNRRQLESHFPPDFHTFISSPVKRKWTGSSEHIAVIFNLASVRGFATCLSPVKPGQEFWPRGMRQRYEMWEQIWLLLKALAEGRSEGCRYRFPALFWFHKRSF